MSGNSIGLSRKLHIQRRKIAEKAEKRAIYRRFRPYFLNGWRYDEKKVICYILNLISFKMNGNSKIGVKSRKYARLFFDRPKMAPGNSKIIFCVKFKLVETQ